MSQTLWNEPGSEDFQDYVPWWREHPLTLVLILIGAVGAVTAIWYVWQGLNAPDDVVLEDDLPVFYSDGGAIKQAPDSPGGKRMPHQDNTVYQHLGTKAGAPAPRASKSGADVAPHLAPPVEEPLPDAERKTPASLARYTQESVPMPAGESAHSSDTEPSKLPAGVAPMDLVVQGDEKVEIQRTADGQEKITVATTPSSATPSKSQHANGRVTTGTSEWRIQLASLGSREKAEKEWARLKSDHSDLLGSLSLTVAEGEVSGKGTVYRVQAGPFVNQKQAARFCRNLKERTAQCFPVPPR